MIVVFSDHTHLLFGRRLGQMPPLPKSTIAYGKCRANYARRRNRSLILTYQICMHGWTEAGYAS